MKKFLFSVLSLTFFNFSMNAQSPVITQTSGVKPGDVILQYYAEDTIQSAGPSGASVTWDFSDFGYTESDTSIYLAKSSSIPGADKYPTSNVVLFSPYDSTYLFANSNETGVYALNSYYFINQIIMGTEEGFFEYSFNGKLKPQFKQMSFPSTYGTKWVTQSEASEIQPADEDAPEDSVRGTVLIKDSVVADGYGTLITPLGRFTNALRLKTYSYSETRFETLTDGAWSLSIPGILRDTSYSWWVEGQPGPVMDLSQISATTDDEEIKTFGFYATYYKKANVLGITDRSSITGVEVFPNPARDFFIIPSADNIISLNDVAGIPVEFEVVRNSGESVRVNLDAVEAGLYHATVEFNGQTRVVKVAVTK
jgi:hypothetical protein